MALASGLLSALPERAWAASERAMALSLGSQSAMVLAPVLVLVLDSALAPASGYGSALAWVWALEAVSALL